MSEENSDTEDDWENIPLIQSPQIQRPNPIRPNEALAAKPPRTPASQVGEVPSYNKPPKSTPLADQLNKDQDKKDSKPPVKRTQTANHASFNSGGKKRGKK